MRSTNTCIRVCLASAGRRMEGIIGWATRLLAAAPIALLAAIAAVLLPVVASAQAPAGSVLYTVTLR
jgi:hypothetical protein